ncbi:MAG TPA: SMC-Scp complex subunit ScpB [Phycisphaerae bacterium]|nr:SMC-Scp complex subunit ScpB [Phycisphaerae bacterium]
MTDATPSTDPKETADAPERVELPPPQGGAAFDEGGAAGGAVEGVEGRADLTAESMPLDQVIEALLFSTDVPLSAGKLAEIVGLDSTKPIRQAIEHLNRCYEMRPGMGGEGAGGGGAYRIEERAGGYQLLTLPQYAQYIERLVRKKDDGRLTPASLETLAIVAYKQPITRAGVEVIRGVACGETLRTLMEHNLVKIVGRAEEIGRPMLYGTTRYFLEVFGLANIKDLPKSDALKEPK